MIGIASDHAGVDLKSFLIADLSRTGQPIRDFGPSGTESVDYPDFAQSLCRELQSGQVSRGILICGSGIGMSIAANRFRGVRAALVWNRETAALSRQHNNSNILVLPARFLDKPTALDIVNIWLSTDFEGGRHTRRVEKIELPG
ncbi:MAG: ribose 5-phosphate isomerase B [Bacteroidetes bacterium]|nr:ribose 5-phosphate isomerase B [Bacteroidota bacterium]